MGISLYIPEAWNCSTSISAGQGHLSSNWATEQPLQMHHKAKDDKPFSIPTTSWMRASKVIGTMNGVT